MRQKLLTRLKAAALSWQRGQSYPVLSRATLEVNNLDELKKLYGWDNNPILEDPIFREFRYAEDLNQRRLHDAESIGCVACNCLPKTVLDIGTGEGHTAALLAVNAPNAQVFTVNIPPDEFDSPSAGNFTTMKVEKENIGVYYKSQNLKNITQILANTAQWQPEIGTIDLGIIDGCHDADFVYNDTAKVLAHMRSGGFILWHDFNLQLTRQYPWIGAVCQGIERLFARKLLQGRIFHLKDSWVGIYRVP